MLIKVVKEPNYPRQEFRHNLFTILESLAHQDQPDLAIVLLTIHSQGPLTARDHTSGRQPHPTSITTVETKRAQSKVMAIEKQIYNT